MQIQVAEIVAEVEWKKIKNIHLTLYPPNADVHISAPQEITEEAVRLFLLTKLPWIRRHMPQMQQHERQSTREYVSGENHYYKGQRYLLKVIYHNAPPKVEIQGNEYILLYVRTGASVEKRAEVLREWYRAELKQLLNPLIAKWEQTIGVEVKAWEVKQMKTLWGSCNHRTRHVLFNLELIKKPTHCIEYVVVHELLHIINRLHDERFTQLLNRYYPNWQYVKNELNEFVV